MQGLVYLATMYTSPKMWMFLPNFHILNTNKLLYEELILVKHRDLSRKNFAKEVKFWGKKLKLRLNSPGNFRKLKNHILCEKP